MDGQEKFFYGAAAAVGILCFLMISSYVSYLLLGLLLAFVTSPAHEKLKGYVGRNVSAFTLVILTIVAALLPFTILVGAVGGDAADLLANFQSSEALEVLKDIDSSVTEKFGVELDLENRARDLIANAASILPSGLTAAFNTLTKVMIGTSLMFFLQFYTLKDGKRFVKWTKRFELADREKQEQIYQSIDRSVWAIIKGHVLMAFIQGILAGIGLWVFGVPEVLFWTFVMILLGFIPIVGSAFVWIPASIYLVAIGNTISGIALLLYGLVIVSGSDNLLRPLVVDKEANIHPFFILAGLIGGIGLFGPAGLFIGPVMFGLLKNLLEIVRD
jgi:predicted PurR-regulated permease PerM